MLRKLLDYFTAPKLDWAQVEITSYCNAGCSYCPHTVYQDLWLNRHMSLDAFKRLLPSLSDTRLVYLQGWGEPLLNPQFLDMVRAAKESGRAVGTSSNGTLLDSSMARNLVERGLDIFAVSMAGVNESDDRLRDGTSLERVFEAISILDRAKRSAQSELPRIHIAYMLLRSGLKDIARLPEILRHTGVSQVVISTLDFVAREELQGEAVVPSGSREYNDLRAGLEVVRDEGLRFGIDICFQIRKPGARRQVCTENVERALFVSVGGEVSPCVFTNLPVREGALLYRGAGRRYERLVFGNAYSEHLGAIWRKVEYEAFRESFSSGSIPDVCRDCPKLYIG